MFHSDLSFVLGMGYKQPLSPVNLTAYSGFDSTAAQWLKILIAEAYFATA